MKNIFLLCTLIFISTNSFSRVHYIERANVENCLNEQMIYSGPMAKKICEKKGECYEIINFSYNCRYAKVIGKKVVVDASKKLLVDVSDSQKNEIENSIKVALNRISHGKRVIALMLVRNQIKGLSKGQIKQMIVTYSNVKSMLETGSLETAKDEINLIVPDGVIVTGGDKIALTDEIDKYLGL